MSSLRQLFVDDRDPSIIYSETSQGTSDWSPWLGSVEEFMNTTMNAVDVGASAEITFFGELPTQCRRCNIVDTLNRQVLVLPSSGRYPQRHLARPTLRPSTFLIQAHRLAIALGPLMLPNIVSSFTSHRL